MTEEPRPGEKPRNKDVPLDIQPYFIGLLQKGERWNDTQGAEAADLMPLHLAYIRQQIEAGRYRLAGPIMEDGPLVGLLIISAKTAEEAKGIAVGDPGVQAGRLSVEVYPAFLPTLEALRVRYP